MHEHDQTGDQQRQGSRIPAQPAAAVRARTSTGPQRYGSQQDQHTTHHALSRREHHADSAEQHPQYREQDHHQHVEDPLERAEGIGARDRPVLRPGILRCHALMVAGDPGDGGIPDVQNP